MIGKRPIRSFCTIHTQRDSNINRSSTHRSRSINHSQRIKRSSVEIISQISPILIDHSTINGFVFSITIPTASSDCLFNNFIRVQSASVYSSIFIFCKLFILSFDNITTRKSILINQTSTRRNFIKFNFIPTIFRHKTLNNINLFTQERKSLAILFMRHSKISASNISKTSSFVRRSILTLKPFSKQRRSFTTYIQSQLMSHNRKSILLQLSSFKSIQIVPTAKFSDILKITASSFSRIFGEIFHNNAKEASFTLSTTHITNIKQTLHSIFRIFLVCLSEHKDNISIVTITHCGTHSKHIQQITTSSSMSQSTIFSKSIVGIVFQTIQKFIHNIVISFFSFCSFLGTRDFFSYVYIISKIFINVNF